MYAKVRSQIIKCKKELSTGLPPTQNCRDCMIANIAPKAIVGHRRRRQGAKNRQHRCPRLAVKGRASFNLPSRIIVIKKIMRSVFPRMQRLTYIVYCLQVLGFSIWPACFVARGGPFPRARVMPAGMSWRGAGHSKGHYLRTIHRWFSCNFVQILHFLRGVRE